MPAQIDNIIREIARRLGGSIGEAARKFWLDPFIYNIDFVTPNQLAASATATRNFIVQADSAFAICRTTFTIADTSNNAVAALQPFGSGGDFIVGLTVTLTDSGSGRSLSDVAIPIDSQYGTAQRPYIWSVPKVLDPNSVFSATLTNLDATAYHVRLAHAGYKIFGDIQAWAVTHK